MSWHQLASWTGRGSRQTESFTSETGMLRLRWQTAGEVPGRTGTFRATLHSAISGRPLAVAVEHNGAGSDTAYVSETPRVFFLVIASDDLDWSVAVDEGAVGTPVEGRKPAA
jgi:hypothetical protein